MSTRFQFLRLGMGATAGAAGALAMIVSLARCQVPGGAVQSTPAGNLMTGGVCIGPCLPDPGWGPVDCSPETEVDTLGLETFDTTLSNGNNVAQDWYTYTDGTAALNFMNFADAAVDGGYQPQVQNVPLCRTDDTVDGNRILHVFGGLFQGWGGGMGLAMAKVNGREHSSQTQGTVDGLVVRAICDGQPDAAICPPANAEYAVMMGAIDVSQYEGISFWARRGPNSQAGIHVLVGDKHTDDDLNYLAQRAPFDLEAGTFGPQPIYCQRVRECDCVSHQACVTYPAGSFTGGIGGPTVVNGVQGGVPQYCTLPPPGTQFAQECSGGVGAQGGTGPSNCCDHFQCDQWYAPYPSDGLLPNIPPYNRSTLFGQQTGGYRLPGGGGGLGDPQFAGRPCTPYQWQNGVGGSYCFDPAIDPPPAVSTELCGDHWMTTVSLTTEWQYFMVPFANLRQQGWAKKSEKLDLTSVSVMRFTWDAGWIDYYIDSVSFYRRKNPG